jgi:prepilin-type N-terminal cleavage/methylation domain-containing protein
MRRVRAGQGFTLLELVVVLTVIAVLMGVAVPAYFGFITNTRAAQAVADLQALRAAVYLYYGDVGRWPNESPAGFVPKGVAQNLPKNFSFSNKYYTLDYDNWIPLYKQGRSPNGTDTAVGVSIISRDPKFLLRIQRLIRDAKFTRISNTKYTLEIATVTGF